MDALQQQQPAVPQQPGAPQVAQQSQQASGEPEVLRNLIVNYVPTTIDELQLRQLFEMYGPVESIKIVTDRETRTSRGYGFVKYRFAMSAANAIQYLNGYPLMNKRLKVAYAKQAEAQQALAQQGGGLPAQAGAMAMGGQPQMAQADPSMQMMAAMQMQQMQMRAQQ